MKVTRGSSKPFTTRHSAHSRPRDPLPPSPASPSHRNCRRPVLAHGGGGTHAVEPAEDVAELYRDFEEHGAEAIERLRNEDPGKYLEIIAEIIAEVIPAQVDAKLASDDALIDA